VDVVLVVDVVGAIVVDVVLVVDVVGATVVDVVLDVVAAGATVVDVVLDVVAAGATVVDVVLDVIAAGSATGSGPVDPHANPMHASTATAVEVISTRTLQTLLRRLYNRKLYGLGPADQEFLGGVRRGASPT